jgi:hypothetical protein
MPLVPDKAAFQNSLAGLPLVTLPARRDRDRRWFDDRPAADPQERQCRGRKGGHRDCYGGGARRCFWRTFDLAGPTAHGRCACIGNFTVSYSGRHRASHAKSGRGTLCCDSVGAPARWRESRARSTKAPTAERRAAQRGHQNGQSDGGISRRRRRRPHLSRASVRSVHVMSWEMSLDYAMRRGGSRPNVAKLPGLRSRQDERAPRACDTLACTCWLVLIEIKSAGAWRGQFYTDFFVHERTLLQIQPSARSGRAFTRVALSSQAASSSVQTQPALVRPSLDGD